MAEVEDRKTILRSQSETIVFVDGSILLVTTDGKLQTSQVFHNSAEWVSYINEVNRAIQDFDLKRNTLIDDDKVRLVVRKNKDVLGRRYSPPWRGVPIDGSYYVNIEFKPKWQAAHFTFDRQTWEHIVSGYYKYRDSTEWQQKRNREVRCRRIREKFPNHSWPGLDFIARYYRAPYGRNSLSRCLFDWDAETVEVLVYFYRGRKGHLPYFAFKGSEFEKLIEIVELRLQQDYL